MAIPLVDIVGPVPLERHRPPFFRTKKLAIVGCTPSSRYTPWRDPSWTIAAHASSWQQCVREPDWWFDMHRRECFTQYKSWRPGYYDWLKHQRTPIFMQEAYREIPAAVRYPKERILSEFRPYFTNHVAWMIALALTEGVTHIGLFGCQYKADSEYGVQRESCVYWLGRFEGAGGTVVLPPKHNNLLTTPRELYGYESHDEHGKLIPSYTKAPTVTKDGVAHTLTPVPEDGHVDLMPGPLPVAWDRAAAYGIHA